MAQSLSTNENDDDFVPVNITFPSHVPPQTTASVLTGTSTFHESSMYTPSHFRLLDSNPSIEKNNSDYDSLKSGQKSPFWRPSTPQSVTVTETMSTPDGTRVMQREKKLRLLRSKSRRTETDLPESKSSVLGTTSNMISCIVGAGIIGIPYAMNQTGILAGVFLMIVVAILTDKSLRMLIELGNQVDAKSYEILMEAVFGGRLGFVFISINMFLMSYGAMICYLLIIKQTFASLIMGNEMIMNMLAAAGLTSDDLNQESIGRWILVITSLVVIIPLSMQRDMANLSKTSTISVIFDVLLVFIIAISSPVQQSIEQGGGITTVMKQSTIHMNTFFIGLGVLSFAFVCQDSCFIIAGSLHKPTKKRWAKVTSSALYICTALGIIIGVTGYLGFLEKTEGNVLENFSDISKSEMLPFGSIHTYQAVNMARAFLGLTMFCVYPLASYVCRHVLIVLLFSGNTARTGDDHSVLARWDRRVALTLALYISALVPALLCDSLGTILALTGTVAGSCLSYLGPGGAYLAVNGFKFLYQVRHSWQVKDNFKALMWNYPENQKEMISPIDRHATENSNQTETGLIMSSLKVIAWYFFLMPLWVFIATKGGENVKEFERNKVLEKSKFNKRLSKIVHKTLNAVEMGVSVGSELLSSRQNVYGSIHEGKEGREVIMKSKDDEEDLQELCPPTHGDFILAISYIILGVVALVAGIFSISSQ